MSDDLRQRYAEALAAKFTYPVYRCDRDGENERVEKPDPADRIDQTPYVVGVASEGYRAFWTPTCAELAEVIAAVRDEELKQARKAVRRAEGSENYMAKHLAIQDNRVRGFRSEAAKQRKRAEKVEAANTRARDRLDALIAAGFGATTDTLRELRSALDNQEPDRG